MRLDWHNSLLSLRSRRKRKAGAPAPRAVEEIRFQPVITGDKVIPLTPFTGWGRLERSGKREY